MLSRADIEALIAAGESETVEFKRRLPPEQLVSSIISAFANTRGGILIIGVDDRQGVIGLPQAESELALHRLKQIVHSIMPERAAWEVGRESISGQEVLYLRIPAVPPDQRPVLTSRGQAFTREADRQVVLRSAPLEAVPSSRRVTLFVAMSFREEEEPALVDYWWAVKRAAEKTNQPIEVTRVDLQEGDYEISQEIMDRIDAADIVLADFTLNSRNVYFELGYARGTKSARVVQTARKGTALEFDVRNWRTLLYRNATELEEALVPALTKAYQDVVTPSGGTV